MSASRQEGNLTSGRSNQKLRTRHALIDAARQVVREGRPLTIAGVADVALVSVATAYRYFSTPEELVLETTISVAGEIATDLPADPAQRLDAVVGRLADMNFADEALWRAVLKATLDRWFTQLDLGDEEQAPIRGHIRMDLTRDALTPLRDRLPPQLHRRLTMAVMLIYGIEAMVSARDACGLDVDEAKQVMRWAAQALLRQALDEGEIR